MAVRLNAEDGAYRRGLVLGLTMAEILTLVLFALLLALAFAFTEQERAIAELREKVQAYSAVTSIDGVVLATAERLERLRQDRAPERDPKDYFTELVAGIEEAQRIKSAFLESEAQRREAEASAAAAAKESERLASELQAIKKERDGLKDALAQAGRSNEQAIKEAVERAGFDSANPGTIEDALNIARALQDVAGEDSPAALLEDLRSAANEAGRQPRKLVRDVKDMQVALNDARGMIESLKRQIGGPPGVLPPCWSDEAKKPEYVFDVRLASKGIEARLRNLPHRRQQLMELLGTDKVEPIEMPDSRFATLTRKMYDWSVAQNCRFYVVVYDGTGPEEKAIYKTRLRTVEGHFYKRLADETELW